MSELVLRDGAKLAFRELGRGPALLLLALSGFAFFRLVALGPTPGEEPN